LNKELKRTFTRILGIQVGNKVKFLDFHNYLKYGTVVESDRGLLRIHFFHNGIEYGAVRHETEVELVED